jgi:hypothetical protein
VGDGNCCVVFDKAFKSFLDMFLALDIDCTGCLVKNDDLWLLDDAPGDGDSLFLPSA